MNKKGFLTVVSGFSGSGKGTVLKILTSKYSNYKISVSCTTRNRRDGEREGVDYFYKTDDEFEHMIETGGFLEYAGFVGKYYGTPKRTVDMWLDSGLDVILEIEVNGAMQVMQNRPEAGFIFILPPSAEELKNRLVTRGRENADEIQRRLTRACDEIKIVDRYNYIVINNNAEECAAAVHEIITAEKKGLTVHKYRSDEPQNAEFLERLKEDFTNFIS